MLVRVSESAQFRVCGECGCGLLARWEAPSSTVLAPDSRPRRCACARIQVVKFPEGLSLRSIRIDFEVETLKMRLLLDSVARRGRLEREV